MINMSDTGKVVCRPALPADTENVMELCSHIWNGGDYIPLVWEEWMSDPDGLLGVAELSGRIVGVFKLTKFQETEWYMEGLRVHPDVQGMGIASHIHEYVVDTWRRMGKGKIRLVTHSENIKVHHMCEQDGFTRIAEFIPFRAPSSQEVTCDFSPATADQAQRVLDYVSISPTHALSAGLINLGWVYADPQIKHIQEAIQNNHAWWWRDGLGFISIWEDVEGEDHEPGIQLIASRMEDLSSLLIGYRSLMSANGYNSAGWVAPNHLQVIRSLQEAGFLRAWDKSLFVYELRI